MLQNGAGGLGPPTGAELACWIGVPLEEAIGHTVLGCRNSALQLGQSSVTKEGSRTDLAGRTFCRRNVLYP